jgi:hypothetical protein
MWISGLSRFQHKHLLFEITRKMVPILNTNVFFSVSAGDFLWNSTGSERKKGHKIRKAKRLPIKAQPHAVFTNGLEPVLLPEKCNIWIVESIHRCQGFSCQQKPFNFAKFVFTFNNEKTLLCNFDQSVNVILYNTCLEKVNFWFKF